MTSLRRRWALVIVTLVTMVLPLLPAGKAEAAPFGRSEYYGYFLNRCDNWGGFVFTAGLHPAAAPGVTITQSFINRVMNRLNTAGRDQVGAAFIILTMLGYPVGTAESVAHNAAVIARWQAAVNYYSANGWIDWSGNINWTQNTFWQGMNGNTCSGSGGAERDDVAWYDDTGSTTDGIVFHKAGTAGYYRIRKECANPNGTLTGLEEPGFDVTMTADSNGTSTSVLPGQSYQVGVDLHNSGPAASTAGTIQVMMPGSGISAPCGPVPCTPATQGALIGYGGARGFRGNSTITGISGTNWFWDVTAMPNGGGTSGSLQFTVAPGATPGSTITFNVYYRPGDEAGILRSASVQFRVVTQRIPAAVGYNADIHAGGGLCNQTLSNGVVRGATGAGSMGEYVVSASLAGGINGFTSNGTGSDSLRLGQNGAYAIICRPDLRQAAEDYRNAGAGYTTLGTGVNDLDVTGKSGVIFYDGTNLTIHGTVNNKLTVVARSGNVTISGAIARDAAAYAPRNAPSLGIISNGNIDIRAGVTRVDAYLFANGTIDTCSEASNACATPLLVINGFLMGRNIAFHRIGATGTNGAVTTEQVTFTPQIFLNPPKLFDASVDDVLLEGQGERQPRF